MKYEEEIEITTLYNFNKKIEQLYSLNNEYLEKKESFEKSMARLTDKDKEELSSWLMRQYFSDKNKNDFWYNDSVTKDNVLCYINISTNCFPHTLLATIEQFKLNKQLNKELNKVDIFEEETNKQNQNSKDIPLREIGEELGISAMAVMNIEQKAAEKFKKNFILWENPKFQKYFYNLIEEVADLYAYGIIQENSVDDFLAYLISNDLIKSKDIEFLSGKELNKIEQIILNKKDYNFLDIETIFINDFSKEIRNFKMFQYSVARIIHPYEIGKKKQNEN